MSDFTIRPVSLDDAGSLAAIYAPIVQKTHISFEVDPPPPVEMARRVAQTSREFPWLVLVERNDVVGYAYAGPHGSRAAYRWSVDTSIYLAGSIRGRGAGSALYCGLLQTLRTLGYVSAFAGIALPNEASVALHRKVGFVETGSFPVAGYKLGAWWDVSLWRCALAEPPDDPVPPIPWR